MTGSSLALPMLVGLVALALAFDFLNGLHDAANSIATVVSTRVLRPFTAVIWAAVFNFVAIAVFGLHVAQTLGTGIIDAGAVNESVIFGALVGAIVWNIASWLLAFPTSSSHALIGGLLGAGIAHIGIGAVVWSGVIKTAFGIVLAPLSGFVIAVALVIVVSRMSARSLPFAVDRRFRHLQLLSAALYSLGHGGNDAQKTMGVIAIPPLFQRSRERRLQRSALGYPVLPGGNGARNAVRRLAHRPDHGFADYPSHSDAGLVCRDRRGGHPVCRYLAGRSCLDDPHNHRRHHRS